MPIARFIHSPNSRSPLACNKDQLARILTHYQVMPQFLDIVFTLKASEEPCTQTIFRCETCLDEKQSRLCLPSLGRSGFRIQHCFNLLGVERELSTDLKSPWSVRQTGAYFSFDVVEGRSTWIFLKSNRLLQQRILETVLGPSAGHQTQLEASRTSFLSNLRTHLLILEWCAENWNLYVDSLENRLNRFKTVTRLAPVTTWSARPDPPTVSKATQVSEIGPPPNANLRGASPTTSAETKAAKATGNMIDRLDLADMFSFDQLQSLHRLEERLEQVEAILKQNQTVLEAIVRHFKSLFASDNFKTHMPTTSVQEDISSFFRQVDTVQERLEQDRSRVRNLLRGSEKNTILVSQVFGCFLLRQPLTIWYSSTISCNTRTCAPENSSRKKRRSQLCKPRPREI